ncbi:hypothetical protein CPB85DRAFT_1303301 [Mucidula mucida]|nr:hypothetical protein CPB85DRAFT_1303301 [Mucidula mucida]
MARRSWELLFDDPWGNADAFLPKCPLIAKLLRALLPGISNMGFSISTRPIYYSVDGNQVQLSATPLTSRRVGGPVTADFFIEAVPEDCFIGVIDNDVEKFGLAKPTLPVGTVDDVHTTASPRRNAGHARGLGDLFVISSSPVVISRLLFVACHFTHLSSAIHYDQQFTAGRSPPFIVRSSLPQCPRIARLLRDYFL